MFHHAFCALVVGEMLIHHLFFRPSRKDFIFTNITLVASHGLPNEMTPHEARDAMIRHSGKYKHVYIKKLGLHTYINIVYGCMTSINRSVNQIIILQSLIEV